jgi:hydroxypyruvate isomerase
MRRRDLLGAVAAAGLAAALPACAQDAPIVRRGRIKQGLWRVNFGVGFGEDGAFTIEDMCREAARLGVHGFDLFQFDDIPTLESHGLKLLLAGPGDMDFLTGLIHPEVHDRVAAALTAQADLCAQHGVPGIASNAGQLRGLSYAQAADNAVEVLNRVKDHLAERGAAICIENVNDRRPDEPSLGRDDMAFGHWDWGMEVVERVDSPGVKLLCDIYHLQIMDGDVARRIRDSIHRIGHFHVAGVPTRTEIDEGQELNYRYIAEVIAGLDYGGYVSHEWRPSPGRDPLESIARAVEIMDV